MSIEQGLQFDLPKDPVIRAEYDKKIEQVEKTMLQMHCDSEYLKETLAEFKKEFGIPGKFIRKIVTGKVKANFNKTTQENEAVEELFNETFGEKGSDTGTHRDADSIRAELEKQAQEDRALDAEETTGE